MKASSGGAEDVEAIVTHLISLSSDQGQAQLALRLCRALLAEYEWRQASSASSAAMALPPDPGAWISSRTGGQRCRVSELVLPVHGTVAAVHLLSAVHAVCCEAAANCKRWEEVEGHARAGLTTLQGLHRSSEVAVKDWVAWRTMGLAHAALLAARRLAGDAVATPAMLASHRSLLRQMQDYCTRREQLVDPQREDASKDASEPVAIDAILRLVVAAAACATDGPEIDTTALRDEVFRSLSAALQCASRELTPMMAQPSTSAPSPVAPTEVAVAKTLEELLLLAAGRGATTHMAVGCEDKNHQIGGEVLVADEAPAADGVEFDARPNTKRARTTPRAADPSTRAALLRCGSLVARLLKDSARSARCGAHGVESMIDLCLPDAAVSELAAMATNAAFSPTTEARRAAACALHDRAAYCAAGALTGGPTRVATCSVASSPTPMQGNEGEDSGATARLLRAAERDVARAMSLRAATPSGCVQMGAAESLDTDASDSDDVVAALACRRTHAALLLMLDRAADAAAQVGGPPSGTRKDSRNPPSASRMGCDDATAHGVLRACIGDTGGALEALQHAFAAASSGGRAAALPLYNLVCLYDRTRQWDAALDLAQYFDAADFGLGRSSAQCVLVHAEASPPAAPAVHDVGNVLCPVGADYLRARALLLAGLWVEGSAAMRALLDNERALRATLCAFNTGESHLLRQVALAMLYSGEHHELIELLRSRGMVDDPNLADLVADALFCEGEATAALEAANASLETIERDRRGGDEDKVQATTELRARNNRACYLAATRRFAEAERELLAAVKIAPAAVEPSYNLALLRWDVGERRRAAEGWLRFRRWSLEAMPDYYLRLAEHVLPAAHVLPPTPQSATSCEVDAASAAKLDRAALRHWAEVRSEQVIKAHWMQTSACP